MDRSVSSLFMYTQFPGLDQANIRSQECNLLAHVGARTETQVLESLSAAPKGCLSRIQKLGAEPVLEPDTLMWDAGLPTCGNAQPQMMFESGTQGRNCS